LNRRGGHYVGVSLKISIYLQVNNVRLTYKKLDRQIIAKKEETKRRQTKRDPKIKFKGSLEMIKIAVKPIHKKK
jgi:hypothetical protein